jgi:hypothetical protein
MTRPIDADALKDDILKSAVMIDDRGIQTGYEIAIELIKKQPTIDVEPQWIPCSERLPEVRQWVLCQCRAGIMDVLRLTEDGSWYKGYPNAEYMSGFVVAWMPLPKPYEEKVDDDAARKV